MDSASIQTRGVGSWMAFTSDTEPTVLANLPSAMGVYVILLGKHAICRLGASDIAYIGKATNRGGLRGRVRQYFHPGPTQSTNIAMRSRLNALGCALRIGFTVSDSGPAARRLEADLLNCF
jgi:excinuclease UvrABC nuclease subunit